MIMLTICSDQSCHPYIYIWLIFFPFVKWFETYQLLQSHCKMQHSMMQWNLNNSTMYVYTKKSYSIFQNWASKTPKVFLFLCFFSSRAIHQREILPNTKRGGQDTLLLLQAAVLPKWKSPGSTGLHYLV